MCQELFRVKKTSGSGCVTEIRVCQGELLGITVREESLWREISDALRGRREDWDYFIRGVRVSAEEYRERVVYCSDGDSVIDGISVAENIFLGDMSRFARFMFIDKRQMMRSARAVLERASMGHIYPDMLAKDLTSDQKRLLAVARLLCRGGDVGNGRFMILGDILFSVSEQCRRNISALIRVAVGYHAGGVMLTRDNDIAKFVCDRCEEIVGGGVSTEDIGRMISERKLSDTPDTCEAVMRAVNLCFSGVLSNISFKLYRGEVLGLFGAEYSGVHRIGRILCGDILPERGRVYVHGHSIRGVRSALKYGVYYIGQGFERSYATEILLRRGDIYILDMSILRGSREGIQGVLERVESIRSRGGSVILISDDPYEHILLCDRIKVISDGREVYEVSGVRGCDAEAVKRQLREKM